MDGQNDQIIIAIDREFGSGGQAIAAILSQTYGIPLYEKNILQLMGLPWNDEVESYYTSENPCFLKQKTMRGLTGTNEERFCAMEFQFLQEQAESGASFIVLGHCAGYILEKNPHMLSFYIHAGEDFKLNRIMNEHHLDEQEARKMMKRHNKKRRQYHNQYVPFPWGDSHHYDLCLSSDLCGVEGSARVLELLIDEHYGHPAFVKKHAATRFRKQEEAAAMQSAALQEAAALQETASEAIQDTGESV